MKQTPYHWPTQAEQAQVAAAAAEVRMCPVRLWLHYLDCKHEREQHAAEHSEQIEDETFEQFVETYKDTGVWDEMKQEAVEQSEE